MAPKVSYSKKVVEAYKALSTFIVHGGKGMPPHWPFSIIETNWYYAQFLPKELLGLFNKLNQKGISKKKKAELFWGPTNPSHWFYIADFPFNGLTPVRSEEFIEKTIDLISSQRKNDMFCRDGRNVVLSLKEIEKLCSDAKFFPVNKKLARKIGEFNITMWHYCILIQIGHRSYSQEFHGPYKLKSGEVVFIRDFFNLKPIEVWGFADLPFKKLRVVEVYKKDIGLRVDMLNHYSSAISMPENVTKIALSIDNKFVRNRKELLLTHNKCKEVLRAGNKEVVGFTKPDWIKKIIGMRYLWLKPAKELLGENWEPPKRLYQLANETKQAEKESAHWVRNMQAAVMNLPPNEAIEKVTQLFLNNIYQL